ncbi:MOG interacting and ectopic P-granules protein 1 isoform X2 [Ceratitis capitata]|uniref:MOG interacting and ectopic P-granules protein 1 isoform X2 n=1 Tax=Ceratitis capitata TaxID=7213 RepID=UPI000A10EB9D|nr:MOG interacting and ectopic P-granules protein 1 isoform X2 [Ceratitis capitata]
MTEVDGIMPEATTQSVSSTSFATSEDQNSAPTEDCTPAGIGNDQQQQLKDQQNGLNKQTNSCGPISDEQMEVDGADTEEDDSQMTASSTTENGRGAVGGGDGDDSKMSTGQDDGNASEADKGQSAGSKTGTLSVSKPIVDRKENSRNFCNEELQNSNTCTDKSAGGESDEDVDETPRSRSTAGETADPNKDSSNAPSESLERPATVSSNTGSVSELEAADTTSQDEKAVKCKDIILNATKDETDDSRSVGANDPMDVSTDPLSICSDIKASKQNKENGVRMGNDASGFVDLGDDSDEEILPTAKSSDAANANAPANADNSELTTKAAAVRKTGSICSDSDGAVVIASDSDTEANSKATKQKACNETTQVIDDDEDDDCVVIEDDTPAPAVHAGQAISDLNKRKNMTLDSPQHSDDSQPPNKRQRSMGPSTPISIKDARSLMAHDTAAATAAAVAAAKKVAEGGIYPVNITPAAGVVSSSVLPKLMPVSNTGGMTVGNSGAISATSFTGLGNANAANLLPGLTDDMFVLEAPSFIVPYIYEKPPVDNLKNIVKDIESKYKLTKEDLADADKSDEFDMMTEQNKEDKDDKSNKKKKRRRGGDDPDESWSEESDDDDDDDDDDDSESGMRTKVLIKEVSDDLPALKGAIKPAAALVQSPSMSTQNSTATSKPGQENYFESPLGKFFMDIGVGLVQEFVQSDLIRLQKRKMRKSLGKNITEFERAISALSGNLEASRKKNAPFKFTMKRCEFCNFKSESALSMANHYETPHMNGALYKCNFCAFEIRNATEIVYHMEAIHNIKARLIKPLPYHQCPNCGFEDNGKAKLGRHQPVCAKKFRPEINLAPPADWEAPAKIPRIKPRHGLVGTATAYQAMAAQAAAQKAALASIQQQQQAAVQARNMQAAAMAAQNAANKIRGRPPVISTQKGGPLPTGPLLRGPAPIRSQMATNVVQPNNYQVPSGQLLQAANAFAKKTLSGQPSISITPLPRQNTAQAVVTSPSTSKMPPGGIKPGQSPMGAAGANSKAQFVICEICDGYLRDLEQLRNHMQWIHKVKIHPKMIYNRPPLNCQKCHFRFFTDQGLERHLLGSHGLVTSSMQEAANKGKDAGRCPICGRMYQWKLLNHVSRDHHMTLKPAHLSYKCTVCTATFGMYKQFETHVYTAHSTVAKKAMDGKKNNASAAASSGSSMPASSSGMGLGGGLNHQQRSSLMATNDSLLKPLKINDEITIIPQPSSKPRITNLESHIIE